MPDTASTVSHLQRLAARIELADPKAVGIGVLGDARHLYAHYALQIHPGIHTRQA